MLAPSALKRLGETVMKYRRPFLLLAILLASLNFSPAVRAATAYDDGIENFSGSRYHAAEANFEQALAANPNDTRALLMLGRTREFLKDSAGAKEAYTAAFNINPFNADGAQAKSALFDLTAKVEAQKHAPKDDERAMRKSAQLIQQQGRDLGQRHINYGNALARDRLNLTFLSALAEGQPLGRLNWRQRGEVSSWEQTRQAFRQFDDRAQAINYRANATRTAAAAQTSANNLILLLAEQDNGTNPHLRALGTNLYVRNYGSSRLDDLPPDDPPLELRARAWKLADMPKELHAKARKL
jgi:tetratricopeptide (TPR) repeat protein